MGFASINELLQQTKEKNTSICRLMMAHEAELEGVSEDAVFAQMLENWQIMQKSIDFCNHHPTAAQRRTNHDKAVAVFVDNLKFNRIRMILIAQISGRNRIF